MLRSFRLGNHKSFLEEQELMLMPSIDRKRFVLPVTAIYGANASGKSNLLDGLQFMRSAVLSSFRRWDALEGVPRMRFRLDPRAAESPSIFVAEFRVEDVPYTYGFTLNDERILEEWLYSYPKNRSRKVFERSRDQVKFGSTLAESHAKLEVLEEMTRHNALLLSVAIQSNVDFAKPVYQFFSRFLIFSGVGAGPVSASAARFVDARPENRERVVELLRVADMGITDLVIEENEDPFWRRRQREVEARLKAVESQVADSGTEVDPRHIENLRRELDEFRQGPARTVYQIKTVHGHSEYLFDLTDESQGTRSWLRLIPTALTALDRGSVLVVDEIDSSLHPLLTARLVGLFRDERTNPNGAQLIFTTHDTSLLGTMLDGEVLQRDEVWFVSKKDSGSSDIYALSDFKPRAGENTERRYLRGSYGAVPFLDHDDFVAAVGGGIDQTRK
ncbi:AAA family ATPase [Saccharopolyspora phatthalungensis]|uniref:ATPase AAA-type core domain-containing protein n=1 Tax=Saccharopolyspora phatthalungensis TaxID=664693 RepID=A0A840Q527_9PSEU|nr:ATP-binding protein [Saccharopolyspora phatthalungensis]MBB5155684.1 hypothetical protein [Saccharopolyspora phatthalungensis]